MQLSTQQPRATATTNRDRDVARSVASNPGAYQSLLTEVAQTHVMPFDQFQQLHQGRGNSPSSRRSAMRRTVSHATELLEARLRSLHELGELVEVASFDESVEEMAASSTPAEFEVLQP